MRPASRTTPFFTWILRDSGSTIGSRVTVGHRVVLHGCTIENDALIGIGAIVLNGARIGNGSIVAAGALVPEGMQISRQIAW